MEDPSLVRPQLTTARLGTDEGHFVDEHGRRVLLRGVNVGNRSKMPPFLPFDDDDPSRLDENARTLMTAIHELGANAIRLTFSWEALEPERGTYDEAYVGKVRALMNAAEQANLLVVLDFHQDVFQAAFCGDGFPAWTLGDIPHGEPHYDCGFPNWSLPYFQPDSEVSQAFDRFYANADGIQDAFESMWRKMAREFGDHPALAAFEVINEPGFGSHGIVKAGEELLPALYDRIAIAIEEEAGEAAVLGGEPAFVTAGKGHLHRPMHARFVYAPHYYDSRTILGVDALDDERIRTDLSAVLSTASDWAAPIVLGEFGAPNDVEVKPAYLELIHEVLDEHLASGMMWDASVSATLWNGEDFSVFAPDGSEHAWAGVLDRPLVRAAAGSIEKMYWDADERAFEASVRAELEVVSEVYLPRRHFGRQPRLRIQHARWRWLQAQQLLLVAADVGTTWTLTVEAS